MDKKDTLVSVIGIVITAVLMFIAGTKYETAINKQLQYQVKLKVSFDANVKDSIIVFDGKRKVGTVPLTYGEPYAELILSDNANK
jgi:hypothetical protein